MRHKRWHVIQDVFIIAISLAAALYLAYSGVVDQFIDLFSPVGNMSWQYLPYLGVFVAGLFFTSAFTTAPAIVVLGEFARHSDLVTVALIGGVGAAIGDFILFTFVKDRVAMDLKYLFHFSQSQRSLSRRFLAVFHARLFHFLAPFIGGLIIASPLPDELGVTILGLSRMNKKVFLLMSLGFNILGVYIIGLIARTVF